MVVDCGLQGLSRSHQSWEWVGSCEQFHYFVNRLPPSPANILAAMVIQKLEKCVGGLGWV